MHFNRLKPCLSPATEATNQKGIQRLPADGTHPEPRGAGGTQLQTLHPSGRLRDSELGGISGNSRGARHQTY